MNSRLRTQWCSLIRRLSLTFTTPLVTSPAVACSLVRVVRRRCALIGCVGCVRVQRLARQVSLSFDRFDGAIARVTLLHTFSKLASHVRVFSSYKLHYMSYLF